MHSTMFAPSRPTWVPSTSSQLLFSVRVRFGWDSSSKLPMANAIIGISSSAMDVLIALAALLARVEAVPDKLVPEAAISQCCTGWGGELTIAKSLK